MDGWCAAAVGNRLFLIILLIEYSIPPDIPTKTARYEFFVAYTSGEDFVITFME
jgi:hypothetical protein